jgi:hypothetical protein
MRAFLLKASAAKTIKPAMCGLFMAEESMSQRELDIAVLA